MSIQVQCKQCQATLRAPDSAAGKRIKCPRCNSIVSVESAEDDINQGKEPNYQQSRSAVIVVPTDRQSNASDAIGWAPHSSRIEVRSLQKKRGGSRNSVNRNLVIAMMLMFAMILIGVAAGAYWLGRSSPESDKPIASNEGIDNSAQMRPIDTAGKVPQDTASRSTVADSTVANSIDSFSTKAASASSVPPESAEVVGVPNAAERVPPAEASNSLVTFEPLLLDEPVTSLTMSEDGSFLIMSHQSGGLVSIFDVVADKVVQVITTPSPRALLSRGDQLFVGNFGEGTISVYSASKRWALENELQVTKPNIVFMSAAGKENFGGEILVTVHGPGRQASYQDSHIYRVDAQRDRCEPIGRTAMASVSFDGKNVLTQASFNLSPSGGLSVYSYDEFIAGDAKPIFQGGIQQTPFVYQCYPGSYWLSENMVFGGAPIALIHDKLGSIVIPDAMQKVVYVMDENTLSARRLNSSLTEIEERPRKLKLPSDETKTPSRVFHQLERRRSYLLDHPVAATHGNRLTLFLLDQTNGAVLRAQTAAFAEVSRVESAAPVRAVEPERMSTASSSAVTPTPEPARVSKPKVVETLNGWPELVSAGLEFKHQFPYEQGQLKVELIDGPSGMKVNSAGLLTWTPANSDVGLHELKLRVEQSSGPFFERPGIEVVSAELAKSVGGDLSKVNQFESFELDTDHYAVAQGLDRKSLLLLQGKTLRILRADGITVERTVELPQRYHDIEERQDVYVAVSSQPPFVDVIDKKSLKVRKHIDLLFPDFKILEVTDLSIHPELAISYVCVKNSIELPRYTVVVVDETSGLAKAPGIIGTWSEVSPDGQTLYTGYRDIYEKGVTFHINPGWRLIEIPEYGNVDMLLAWTTDKTKPSLRKIVRQAGGNGNGIRLSPDGNRLVYLSHVGTPMHSNNLVGFATLDFEKGAVHYATKDRASTKEAAFHPNLPWVAMPGVGSVAIFDQDTGALIENRLLATVGGLGSDAIERMYFSPDGRSIICLRSGGESGRYLQRIPLILKESESSAVSRRPAVLPKPKPKVIPAGELHSLQAKAATNTITPREVGRDFKNSVVVVRNSGSAGTGFIVGNDGYVLTCAHVVSDGSDVTVAYHTTSGQEEFTSAAAEVLRIDHDLDIALLKFKPKRPLASVRFGSDQMMESGEPVTVIGNPGAGDAILSHTMTNGIVSNPKRELEGQIYIQLSAAVNPGNSGGPMFDQHGNVAGLIALKANIEGAGFAIPAKTLKEFLEEAVGNP